MLLYKLPRFYNAYATLCATMIFFSLEPSVFIPKGGGILEHSNLRVYICVSIRPGTMIFIGIDTSPYGFNRHGFSKIKGYSTKHKNISIAYSILSCHSQNTMGRGHLTTYS